MAPTLIGRQAVVIDAGMAGLAAGTVLADYFEEGAVLERDDLPSESIPQRGRPLPVSGERRRRDDFWTPCR
jgi:hypothetical protein